MSVELCQRLAIYRVLVTVDNNPSFRNCCRVALICNLGDWFLILVGWWTEDMVRVGVP